MLPIPGEEHIPPMARHGDHGEDPHTRTLRPLATENWARRKTGQLDQAEASDLFGWPNFPAVFSTSRLLGVRKPTFATFGGLLDPHPLASPRIPRLVKERKWPCKAWCLILLRGTSSLGTAAFFQGHGASAFLEPAKSKGCVVRVPTGPQYEFTLIPIQGIMIIGHTRSFDHGSHGQKPQREVAWAETLIPKYGPWVRLSRKPGLG